MCLSKMYDTNHSQELKLIACCYSKVIRFTRHGRAINCKYDWNSKIIYNITVLYTNLEKTIGRYNTLPTIIISILKLFLHF